jgi:curved DNA-binding protein CbpA
LQKHLLTTQKNYLMNKKKNLYNTLGVDKNASYEEIKKAYRDKAKKHHTDKGGDDDEMKELNCAYGVLKIPSKREFYDRTGETEDTPFDKKFQSFIQEVFISHIIPRCSDIEHEDLINEFKNYISNFIEHSEEIKKSVNLEITKLEKVIERTKSKKANIIKVVLEGNVQMQKHKLAETESNIAFGKEAYDHLKDYNYEFVERPKNKVRFHDHRTQFFFDSGIV